MYNLCDKSNNATSHHIFCTTYYTRYCASRVLTGIYYLHVIVVQRSLAVVRPIQAFLDAIFGCRIMFATFPTATYRTCTEASSGRGINGIRRRHQWLVYLIDFRCKGIHRCGRYPVPINLYAKEDKKKSMFGSAQAWRPSTNERAHSSFIPLTTALQPPSLCSCGRYVAA